MHFGEDELDVYKRQARFSSHFLQSLPLLAYDNTFLRITLHIDYGTDMKMCIRDRVNAERLPSAPATSNTAAMLAAIPVQMVATSLLMNCMVSYIPRPAYTEPPGELI